MKKYIAYLDDGENGEIVKIKDVTEEYPISSSKVKWALERAGFGETEKWLIVRALELSGITEENT